MKELKAMGLYLLGLLISIGLIFRAGKQSGVNEEEEKRLKEESARHERMNNADLGIGATDADNVKWLQDFAAGDGDRPAEKTRRSTRKSTGRGKRSRNEIDGA